MDRDLIFISHSTPQDNYFAAWLASKLKLLGYNVWVDLENLSVGDSFNTKIKPIITERTIVFIAVTTEYYSNKANDQHSGVAKELNCASTIDTKILKHNFILPIRVDSINYNNFPYHYIGWNSIDFNNNWQTGLVELIAELNKISVPVSENIDNPISLWFDAIQSKNHILKQKEKYYSNWFTIHLPEYIFIHKPNLLAQKNYYELPFSHIVEAKKIISFTDYEFFKDNINIVESRKYNTNEFFTLDDIQIYNDFILKEPRKKLVKLLNVTFRDHLYKNGLICYSRGKKRQRKICYFRSTEQTRKRVSLKRYNKARSARALVGHVKETIQGDKIYVNWHFALNAEAALEPWPHYKVFYSIIFTDDRFIRFNKVVQHKLRRSVPADWFNRKWAETLLAAMLKISKTVDSLYVEIPINDDETLKVENEPFFGYSIFGYNEPRPNV